jgi:hypothetical protein
VVAGRCARTVRGGRGGPGIASAAPRPDRRVAGERPDAPAKVHVLWDGAGWWCRIGPGLPPRRSPKNGPADRHRREALGAHQHRTRDYRPMMRPARRLGQATVWVNSRPPITFRTRSVAHLTAGVERGRHAGERWGQRRASRAVRGAAARPGAAGGARRPLTDRTPAASGRATERSEGYRPPQRACRQSHRTRWVPDSIIVLRDAAVTLPSGAGGRRPATPGDVVPRGSPAHDHEPAARSRRRAEGRARARGSGPLPAEPAQADDASARPASWVPSVVPAVISSRSVASRSSRSDGNGCQGRADIATTRSKSANRSATAIGSAR